MKNNALYIVYEYDSQLFENLFCRNTNLPELECHGQCMLTDIQNEQSSDDANTHLLKQFQIEVLYYKTSVKLDIPKGDFTLIDKNLFNPYENLYKFLYTKENIKPPKSFIS